MTRRSGCFSDDGLDRVWEAFDCCIAASSLTDSRHIIITARSVSPLGFLRLHLALHNAGLGHRLDRVNVGDAVPVRSLRLPAGRWTPNFLASTATVIFTFISPNPGSDLMLAASSFPVVASRQTR